MSKTIFFDFNGTIIDDLELCLNILNKMLIENGQVPVDLEKYKNIFTFPIKSYYVKAGFDFTKKSYEDLSVDFINYYQTASFSCELHEGVVAAFEKLHKLGHKVVVLSASHIENLKEQIEEFGITKYFDAILGINDIYAKSKVGIGIDYINSNNINPKDCIMIGDTLHDQEVAQAMGIDVVLYDKGHQAREVLLSNGAKVVSSFDEFIDIINGE